MRALDKREAKFAEKRKIMENVVFHVDVNATPLEYPRDIARLTTKRGRTYNEQTEKHETRPFSDYAEGRLHMEVVLVLWGAGGRGNSRGAPQSRQPDPDSPFAALAALLPEEKPRPKKKKRKPKPKAESGATKTGSDFTYTPFQ